VVDVLVFEALLVAGAREVGLTGGTGVDVDSVVIGLHVEADLLLLVLSGIGGDLGSVERGNVAGNDSRGLNVEVDIINAQLLIEPLNLLISLGLWDEAGL